MDKRKNEEPKDEAIKWLDTLYDRCHKWNKEYTSFNRFLEEVRKHYEIADDNVETFKLIYWKGL